MSSDRHDSDGYDTAMARIYPDQKKAEPATVRAGEYHSQNWIANNVIVDHDVPINTAYVNQLRDAVRFF